MTTAFFFLVGFSLLLQIAAAALALRLIWITKAGKAWTLIAIGISLMVVRRLIVLASLINGDLPSELDLSAELIALADSVFLAAGIAAIGPLFRVFHRSEQALLRSRDILEQQVEERTAELAKINSALQEEAREHKRTAEEVQEEQRHLRELLEMYERDRQLVAYEIHDTFVQQVTAAHMNLEVFQHVRTKDPVAAQKSLEKALRLLHEGIAEARWLISGLRPAMLDEFGLAPAVESLARESQRRAGVEIEWSHQVQFDRLPRPLETALYRIIQESLTNALRHSQSEKVRVAMTQQGGKIRIEVEDWGCGFRRQQVASDRYGLQGICERARLFGGRAEIDSVPGRGTRVVVELPWTGDNPAETHAPGGEPPDA